MLLLVCLVAGAATNPTPKLDATITTTATPSRPPQSPQPVFNISVGIKGDVYPAIAHYLSLQQPQDRRWATVSVTVTNPTDAPLRTRISVRVPGWSDEEIQQAELAAGEVRAYQFAPTFLPRLYQNREIAAATAIVIATDDANHVVFTGTVPVHLRAAGDMFWGKDFQYASFIASWVTPHDLLVEQALARAKELMPGRRLPGYESWKSADAQERETGAQVRAIYTALRHMGVSYVKSSLTFGGNVDVSERIRLPHDSLKQVSANCIDSVVLFASLLENLHMDPVVVIVPGHAYVGVRASEHSDRFLYVDTSLMGRLPYETAVRSAARGLARYPASEVTRVDIPDARSAGIYPMP